MQAEQVDNTMDLFLSGLRSDLVMLAESPVLKQGGNITVYIDQPADEKDMIPMTPQAKGGLEAAAYELFRQFGETHKDTVSVISYGTTDGGYLQWPAISRKKGYDSGHAAGLRIVWRHQMMCGSRNLHDFKGNADAGNFRSDEGE